MVAVAAGGSGLGCTVGVSVGNGVGVNAAAVSVNSATTVYAAEVRMASTSGVGTIGVAGAQAARIIPRSGSKKHLVFMVISPVYIR
jgi:hypothetical protein